MRTQAADARESLTSMRMPHRNAQESNARCSTAIGDAHAIFALQNSKAQKTCFCASVLSHTVKTRAGYFLGTRDIYYRRALTFANAPTDYQCDS